MIKVLMALKTGTLPPTANFQKPSPKIPLDQSPFRVLSEPEPWGGEEGSRRAAVSAFGFGGTNAHLLLQQWKEQPKPKSFSVSTQATAQIPVAIVGLGACLAGCNDLDAFSKGALFGTGVASTQNPKWWGAEKTDWYARSNFPSFRYQTLEKLEIPLGQFRIPPVELEEMLPQQLLMLLTAAQAIEDAGFGSGQRLDMGVFTGLDLDFNTNNYQLRWDLERDLDKLLDRLDLKLNESDRDRWLAELKEAAGPALNANRTLGGLGGVVASRVAREFRFGGPCFSLSSEQDSGLGAFEVAVRALQKGELKAALVGAVDPAGDCRAVLSGLLNGAENEKTVVAEGACALVLKTLADAERDGDRIYGVVNGLGVSSEACQSEGINRSLEQALAEAGWGAHRLGLHELGDFPAPLTKDSGGPGLRTARVVDTMGELGSASGLASMLRSALSLYHQVLPMGVKDEEKEKPSKPCYWLRDRQRGARGAAVSSRGLNGQTTSVVLSSYEGNETLHSALGQPPKNALFFVLGGSQLAMAEELVRLRQWVSEREDQSIHDCASAWAALNNPNGPSGLALALLPVSFQELDHLLDTAIDTLGDPATDLAKHRSFTKYRLDEKLFFSEQPLGPEAPVAFVFPGSGNHYDGMGRTLALRWPEVFIQQDGLSSQLASELRPDLFWTQKPKHEVDGQFAALLIAQVALGSAVSDLVRKFGVQPSGVVGYSLGESTALVATKAWPNRDQMYQRTKNSTLFTKDLAGAYDAVRKAWDLEADTPVAWSVGVVNLPAETVRKAVVSVDKAYLLIVNTPDECVIGGDPEAVARVVAELKTNFFPLQGIVAVHCEVLEPVAKAYRDHHAHDTVVPEGIVFYSGGRGERFELSRDSAADAILHQARHGVDFPKTIEAAYEDGFRVFLEMGPGNSCSRMIRKILGDRPHVARSACGQSGDEETDVLRLLARLIAERIPVDLTGLYGAPLANTAEAGQKNEKTKATAHSLSISLGGAPFSLPRLPSPSESPVAPPEQTTVAPAPKPIPAPMKPPPSFSEQETQETVPPGAVSEFQPSTAALSARAEAHEAYLRFSKTNRDLMAQNLANQMALLSAMGTEGETGLEIGAQPVAGATSKLAAPAVAFDRDMCMEFAIGSLGTMLGPQFAPVDKHPSRVRLPDEPLMLVDRILEVDGKPMTSGTVVTEHDVLHNGWYLDGGRIPTCIAIEAGQADLFLSAYLGIDFETKGLATYRLLDAEVTFHGPLPQPGEIIRYHIAIERFFKQGDTHFFRFQFEGSVAGKPLLTMRNGVAGFFSEKALDAGKGIVRPALEKGRGGVHSPAEPVRMVPSGIVSFSDEQMAALRRGDLAGCFGSDFGGLGLRRPQGLPDGLMNLVHRVVHLDPEGGARGMGLIRAEADIHPDDWFLTCHFVDDKVMPGTLMYECCLHTLRVFLMYSGWVGEDDQVCCQPVIGVRSKLLCRGQVLETTKKVTYEVSLKSIGYDPEPHAIADALMYADGKPIVDITDMCIRFSGLSLSGLKALWSSPKQPQVQSEASIFSRKQLEAFAFGKPSQAFGEAYRKFDEGLKIARFPSPPFLLMSRVESTTATAWNLEQGGTAVVAYDVVPDDWFFEADRQPVMPYSILLEIALQSCGWLAAYMGSALANEQALLFRNLGGNGTLTRPLGPDNGTLRTEVKITSLSKTQDIILQFYEFEVRDSGGVVFKGDTYFGFFTEAAMADQVGIPDAQWQQLPAGEPGFEFPGNAPFPKPKMRMIDQVDVLALEGGPHGLGYVEGSIAVDPGFWFFKAHFMGDPVWPGSLGLEALIQLLKVYASRCWQVDPQTVFQASAPGVKHGWSYRGQILPDRDRVRVQAIIKSRDDQSQTVVADGMLMVDGKVIYQMTNFSVKLG